MLTLGFQPCFFLLQKKNQNKIHTSSPDGAIFRYSLTSLELSRTLTLVKSTAVYERTLSGMITEKDKKKHIFIDSIFFILTYVHNSGVNIFQKIKTIPQLNPKNEKLFRNKISLLNATIVSLILT